MSSEKPILLNAFAMNTIGHQSPGLWKHPEDTSRDYNKLSHWVELAQILEEGRFAALFLADVMGVYDAYQNSPETALRSGAQIPLADPAVIVSAMAAATKNLGFGVTAGTAYEHPVGLARRLASLDHYTGGRVGWNVVTGYLESAAKNFGQTRQMEHDERYDHADEYIDVVYKLLEGSWEDDAVVADCESGLFVDPDKVHELEHEGKWFNVPGIAITEPSRQRTPVIFQAGTSSRGMAFAGKHAEAVFVSQATKEGLAKTVKKIREATVAAGRNADDVKIFAMITPVVGKTNEEAWEKFREYQSYADEQGALALLAGWTGIDLSEYPLDAVISEDVESNAIQSAVSMFQAASGDSDKPWNVGQLARYIGVGGFGPVAVGTGREIAEQFHEWVRDTGVDGFNVAYAVKPGTFRDVVDYVIPELEALGVYPTAEEFAEDTIAWDADRPAEDQAGSSLRHALFGRGDRLPENHPGAAVRRGK
ncbi:LLM class flavin-dependent oxidoreductase [Pseudoglutamicibacter cumminsii]|uniref:5,10-methylene tetrahydromethanopterin reductase n=1 Tax=Pseudoglutamicibacter cumminsii TaxID=156979 RepID=A0ABX5L461_9MICC|nr:LLM class flavin-dependent oxidoreductase [Pseudoglutamicibacter cumminsii]PWI27441.1 5,10-methylene tetrahydromethanopterin reductase [Pseudoglutamicibacter cumminsii]